MIFSFDEAQEAALHHYTKSFRGFSAMLTPEQAQKLAEKDSVVSVFESRMNELHTTHSWQFLGIDSINQYKQLPMDSKSNIIVGMIDTGIWPESKSFIDEGLGPVPPKFRGECVAGENFTLSNCNRKIIGVRYYSKGFEAENGPLENQNQPFFRSARDTDGHGTHIASTVAGSVGFGLNPMEMGSSYGLIAGSAAAAPGASSKNASFCKENTLDPTLIKGKIVVCEIESIADDRREKAIFIRQGGGVGIILIDLVFKDVGFQFVIPGTLIGQEEAKELQAYMAMEKNPVAKIKQTVTNLFSKPAPAMAVFSAMGPNIITPDIIKPDITAPGVNILAAWSPVATEATGERSVDYNIISGTSMSCPHVSAVAAILKSIHPSWSPAAVKSAIMTTATVLDNSVKPIGRDPDRTPTTPFDYGSGHINPSAAADPGLIYDFDSIDIIDFLCSTGATPLQLVNLTGEVVFCKYPPTPSYNFNYPSIGVSNMNGSLSVQRTVTYYGKDSTVYYSKVDYPSGVKVKVTPNKLNFSKAGEKMSFRIDMIPFKSSNGGFVFGALTWSNGIHRVRSPIGINVVSV
ncbi:subtilisin-like serine endopeptidase family protein [Actinidia rufa]|uniref:Subtilisin-like serine endopeptidase family protein n=1 Tax=Actinidia rufa TaxID=165716 RepID=A0A7J0H3W5_9ERIC|nr:subtilisin-like serine endopeptidase family protein [Actinidia rufa]